MTFLLILLAVASAVVGVWFVGVFLLTRFSARLNNVSTWVLVVGIPALALAIYLVLVLLGVTV